MFEHKLYLNKKVPISHSKSQNPTKPFVPKKKKKNPPTFTIYIIPENCSQIELKNTNLYTENFSYKKKNSH